ncbi:extracellular solute-binding protein [Paenibacillus lycopersici]|uniref:Extracellular solute-binding protein n=1 Tax=Paenibacillus lycopersici TaxID=2704462 RepID=A0A6C0G314_9BACL|nr:extracellular solute-binding protein [Paenibacillus lycopersici]QHT62842.1 extracellular solute-binding protein [Paenibacillus lycopersici]
MEHRKGKKLQKWVIGAAAAALIVTGGCSNKENAADSSSASGSSASDTSSEKPTEIVYLTTGDVGAKPLVPNDRIIAEIDKRLNIKLTVKIAPESSYDKINVAIASGDIPDVVTTQYPSSSVSQWIKDGILVPLNDYFDKLPTIKAKLDNGLQWTAVDGNYYGYPFVSGAERSNYTVQFRQDWLDKLGLQHPKTLDEFEAALKAVVEKDPDGNGKADTFGYVTNKPGDGDLLTGFDFVLYAYGLPYSDYELNDKGEVIPRFEHPAFKKGIEELRKWYAEKLIDPEFVVYDRPAKEQKFFQGKAGFMDGPLFRHVSRIEGSLQQVNPDGVLGYAPPPAGPDGKQGMATVPKTALFTAVTNKAKNPEKAAEFIEFMLSKEGRDLLELGIEGIHYTKQGDKITYNEAERAKDGFADNGWAHPLAWGNVSWPIDENYLPQTEPNIDRARDSVKVASQYFVPSLITRRTDVEIEQGKNVNEVYNQYFVDLISGKIDVDKGIEELGKKWRKAGGDEILKSVNEEYQKQNASK